MTGIGEETSKDNNCYTYPLFTNQMEVILIEVWYNVLMGINYIEISFAKDFAAEIDSTYTLGYKTSDLNESQRYPFSQYNAFMGIEGELADDDDIFAYPLQ